MNMRWVLLTVMIICFSLSVTAVGNVTITPDTLNLRGNNSEQLVSTLSIQNSNEFSTYTINLPSSVKFIGDKENETVSLSYSDGGSVENLTTKDINLTFTVPSHVYEGMYTATLNFTTSQDLESFDTVDINLDVIDNPKLEMNEPTVTVADGFSNETELVLSATGNKDINTVLTNTEFLLTSNHSITIDSDRLAFSKSTVDINKSESEIVTITVSPKTNQTPGTYVGNISAEYDGITNTTQMTIIVRQALRGITTTGSIHVGGNDNARGDNVTTAFEIKNTGDFDLTDIQIDAITDDRYKVNLSLDGNTYSNSVTIPSLVAGNSTFVRIKASIPLDATSGKVDLGSIRISSPDFTSNVTIDDLFVQTAVKLEIRDVDVDYVKLNGDTGSLALDPGDTIRDVAPGSRVKLRVEVRNLFTDNDDQIEEIEVIATIDDIGEDDVDEESSEFDIDGGRRNTATIEFDVPEDADAENYDLLIEVTGIGPSGAIHTITEEYVLEVERKRDDVIITSLTLDDEKIMCGRSTGVNIQITNRGEDSQDEVKLTVENSQLGLDFERTAIVLSDDYAEDDSKKRFSIPLAIGENIAPGSYTVRAKTFFDGSIQSDIKDVRLTVESCSETQTQQEQTQNQQQTTTQTQEEQNATAQQAFPDPILLEEDATSSFRGSKVMVALIGLFVLTVLIGVIAFGAVLYLPKKPEMPPRTEFM